MEHVVVVQRETIHDVERVRGAVYLCQRHCTVEGDDLRRRERVQLIVQREDLAPVGVGRIARVAVDGVDGRLQLVWSRPIPGDAVVGQFRKSQGLLVHTRDCVTLRKARPDPEQLIDVEWAPDVQGEFDAGVRLLVSDRRGLLADIALAISDAGANIDNVSMEKPDGAGLIAMFFSVQVKDRRQLAHVMRAIKRVPEVRRIHRART